MASIPPHPPRKPDTYAYTFQNFLFHLSYGKKRKRYYCASKILIEIHTTGRVNGDFKYYAICWLYLSLSQLSRVAGRFSTSLIRMQEINRWQSHNLMLISHFELVFARACSYLLTEKLRKTDGIWTYFTCRKCTRPCSCRSRRRGVRAGKVRATAATRFQATFRRCHM